MDKSVQPWRGGTAARWLQANPSPALCPWLNHLAFLIPSFLICKVDLTTVYPLNEMI